jgi:hypothetical protein
MINFEITNKDWDYAKSLYNSLTQEVVPLFPGIVFSNQSERLSWSCALTYGKRTCNVLCFYLNRPLYEIHYEQDNQIHVWGSTYQRIEILSSIKKWLQGDDLQALYGEFEFIDEQKRALGAIESLMLSLYPELIKNVNSQLLNQGRDFYELWYKSQDRSCKTTYSWDKNIADVDFFWGETNLFQVQTEQFEPVALAIFRWLIDRLMPSDIEKEFPWIDTGILAKYYERGQEIEGDFILSWDQIEVFFNEWSCYFDVTEILELIAQMRKRGYDRTLRAGQSLTMFIVSRSRKHGLREDQPCITFSFGMKTGGLGMRIKIDGEETLTFPKIELTPEIDAHLKRLEACNIN